MKHFYKSIAPFLFLLPISSASIAETPEKAVPPMSEMNMNKSKGMHQGMGGMGMMPGMTEEQKDQHLRSFQEHLLKMHDLSNQILAEKDPDKKEQLKNKQLDLMRAHQAQMMEHRLQKMRPNQQMMQSNPNDKK